MEINLGDKVKCQVTGYTGIVVAKSRHIYGCDRVGVQPPLDKDGKLPEVGWFDIDGVELITAGYVVGKVEEKKTGGPALRGQTPTRSNPK